MRMTFIVSQFSVAVVAERSGSGFVGSSCRAALAVFASEGSAFAVVYKMSASIFSVLALMGTPVSYVCIKSPFDTRASPRTKLDNESEKRGDLPLLIILGEVCGLSFGENFLQRSGNCDVTICLASSSAFRCSPAKLGAFGTVPSFPPGPSPPVFA